MSRRNNSRRVRGASLRFVNLAEAAMEALSPAYQFRADTVTLSGSNVATIPNRRGSDSLVLAAGTLAAPTSDILFGGAPSLAFTGTQWLQSNLSATPWAILHDGTGSEVFHVFASTSTAIGVLYATLSDAVPRGHQIYTGSQAATLRTTNGAANLVLSGMAGAAPTNAATYLDSRYAESAAPQIVLSARDIVGIAGPRGAVPTAVAPAGPFTLGAQVNGAFPGSFKWCETLIFNRVLSEYDRQIVREYIQSRYGIVAPVVTGYDRDILSLTPFSWPRADYYSTAASKVTSFSDRARPGHTFAQGNASFQVATPTTDPLFGNQETALFVGASSTRYVSSLAGAAWSFLGDGTGGEIICVYRATLDGRYLWATTSGPFNPGTAQYQNAGQIGLFSMAVGAYSVNTTTGGASPLNVATYSDFELATSQTPQWQIRSKSSVGIGGALLAPANTAAASPFILGARADFAGPFDGAWAECLIFSRILSASERARVQNYILSRYGIAP